MHSSFQNLSKTLACFEVLAWAGFLPLQCPESGLVEHAKPEDTRNKTSKHLGCFRDDLAWFRYPKDKRGKKFSCLFRMKRLARWVSSSCLRRCCRCLFSVLAFLQSQARPQPKQKMIRKCVGLCLWLCLAFSVWTLPFCRFGDGTSTKWLKWNSLIPLEWEALMWRDSGSWSNMEIQSFSSLRTEMSFMRQFAFCSCALHDHDLFCACAIHFSWIRSD